VSFQRAAPLLVVSALIGLLAGCELPPLFQVTVSTTVDGRDSQVGDGVCEMTAGEGDCSLRAAVQEANAQADKAIITLVSGETYPFTVAGVDEDEAASGDLDLTVDVTLRGNGAVIDAAALDRVFEVHAGAARLENLTITGGRAPFGGGVRVNEGATAQIARSTVSENEVDGHNVCQAWQPNFPGPGGFDGCTSETTGVIASSFLHPSFPPSEGGGGGVWSRGTLNVTNSTISHNASVGASFCTSTFVAIGLGNEARACRYHAGGGVLTYGTANVVNSTISNNTAVQGFSGGIADLSGVGGLTLVQVSLVDNLMDGEPEWPHRPPQWPRFADAEISQASGRALGATGGHGLVGRPTLVASIVSGAAAQCPSHPSFASNDWVTSSGYNVGSDASCVAGVYEPTDQSDTDPGLGPLGDHGGPTHTHLPSSVSPVIDVLPIGEWCPGTLKKDQRGTDKPSGSGCDAGAVERQATD
jgi:hypothetical protein